MRVIFLDFDGVINNFNSTSVVDYENVKYLLKIIMSTEAKVVATTSNKYSFQKYGGKGITYSQYVKLLSDYGIEIFDITPLVNSNREQEIIAYLNTHPECTEFLILDDDYIVDSLKDHQVFLDLYRGICKEHVEPSINILNGNLGFYPLDFNFNESSTERAVRINKYYTKKNI